MSLIMVNFCSQYSYGSHVNGETSTGGQDFAEAGPGGGGEGGGGGGGGGPGGFFFSPEQERAFLAPWVEASKAGGVLVVSPMRAALAQQLGQPVAASVVYRLLARHGVGEGGPGTRHPKRDPKVRGD